MKLRKKPYAILLLPRAVGLTVLMCAVCAAQHGGGQQGQGQGAQQGNGQGVQGGQGATPVPLQVEALEDWPTSLEAAEANLDRRVLQRKDARVIWYQTKKSDSSALPVVLVPLTCRDVAGAAGDFGPDVAFVKWCESAKRADARRRWFWLFRRDAERDWRLLTSLPSQNNRPLASGQGLILGIYDKNDLLYKLHTSLLGVAVTAQSASPLNPAPLRPAISSSGGGGGGAGGGGGTAAGGQAPQPQALFALPTGSPRAAPPADACAENTSLTAIEGDDQRAISGQDFRPLKVLALTSDGNVADGKKISFVVTDINGTSMSQEAGSQHTHADGSAIIPFVAPSGTRSLQVVASCIGTSSLAVFHLGVRPNNFYYLPWSGNPVVGDTTLTAAVTAQAPTPTAVTFATSPRGLKIKVGERDVDSSTILTFPTGATVPLTADVCQWRGDVGYRFLAWSDGGVRVHSIAIGPSDFTLTAGFVLDDSCTIALREHANLMPASTNPGGLLMPVTVVTNPPGLSAGIRDPACGTRDNATVCPAGSEVWVSAADSQDSGGVHYVFLNWSDGGDREHKVSIGAEPVKLIANFTTGFPFMGTEAMTVTTVPRDLIVSVNGASFVTPAQLYFAPNTQLKIEVPPRQSNGSQWYACSTSITLPARGGQTVQVPCTLDTRPPGGSTLSILTQPPGLAVVADGITYVPIGNQQLQVPVNNNKVRVDVVPLQSQSGKLYSFSNWSDLKPQPHDVTLPLPPGAQSITANFVAAPVVSAPIPVTIATDPVGLTFTFDGIKSTSPRVVYYPAGSQIALNAPAPQNLGGVQFTFQGWSDGGSSAAHSFSVGQPPGGQQGNAIVGQSPGGQQGTANVTPSASPLTAVGSFTTSPPTEQTVSLLNASYPQTHAVSYFNISTGLVFSNLRDPSWTRQETAPGVTCTAQSPQPCLPSPELYRTVQSPGATPLFPALFFSVYIPGLPFDAERRWRPHDLIPAPSVGFSLSSPTTDFFFGLSFEVLRGVQLVGGARLGRLNELAPGSVNDPTSSAAPTTVPQNHWGGFYGVTFNISFIQTLFGGGKGGGN